MCECLQMCMHLAGCSVHPTVCLPELIRCFAYCSSLCVSLPTYIYPRICGDIPTLITHLKNHSHTHTHTNSDTCSNVMSELKKTRDMKLRESVMEPRLHISWPDSENNFNYSTWRTKKPKTEQPAF